LDENDETLCNSPNLSPHTVSSSLGEEGRGGERERVKKMEGDGDGDEEKEGE